MVNQENINEMYESLIEGKELTTKELNSCGFNSKDLSDLIEQNVIQRVKRGYYNFLAIDDLFLYGKRLINMKEYDKATSCFEKCYELDSNHASASFQLFLRSVTNKDYDKAFEYFDKFYSSDNEYYNSDSKFYLYLLSMITELPEKYRECVKGVKFDDIKVDLNDKRYYDITLQNRVRTFALQQRFLNAQRQLTDIVKKRGKLTTQDIVTRTLLSQAIEVQKNYRELLVEKIVEKDYEGILEYFDEIQKYHNLSNYDSYVILLTTKFMDIQKTHEIPNKQNLYTENLFEAIDRQNYSLALSLCKEYNKEKGLDDNQNVLYLLLNDINDVINNIVNENQSISLAKENNVTSKKTDRYINSFTEVLEYLMQEDLDSTFRTLKNYLHNINKIDYEFLIVDLIKISVIEGDKSYVKPMKVLTCLSRDNFVFDIFEYIQSFYETLSQNRFEEARIYLGIISKSVQLGHSSMLIDNLEQALCNAEKMLERKKNSKVIDFEQVQNVSDNVVEESYEEMPKVSKTIKETKNVTKEESKLNINYDDTEFINQKLEQVIKDGIVLLKPMNDERIQRIHDIVKDIPEVSSFSIDSGDSKRVVLKHSPFIEEKIDFKELINTAKQFYSEYKFNHCINIYRKLLAFNNAKPFVYGALGLSYMKKGKIETAIDYLTVATELSKKEDGKFNYTELINKLKGDVSVDEKKPFVKMKTSDFRDDINDSYEIESIEEIASLMTNGMTLDDACQSIGLDDEQKNVVALIFARECYSQGNYTLGDQYLKIVERTKNKTKFVNSLFDEIRKNKRFYRNRVEENHKRLVLISPTKK